MFALQIVASAIGSMIGSTWQVANMEEATYLDIDGNDDWSSDGFLLFVQKTGTWILIFT